MVLRHSIEKRPVKYLQNFTANATANQSASYRKALEDVNLKTPLDEREELCANLFNQISESDGKLKLTDLLPAHNNASQYKLRNNRMFATPGIKTKRFQNSFIMHYSAKEQM